MLLCCRKSKYQRCYFSMFKFNFRGAIAKKAPFKIIPFLNLKTIFKSSKTNQNQLRRKIAQ